MIEFEGPSRKVLDNIDALRMVALQTAEAYRNQIRIEVEAQRGRVIQALADAGIELGKTVIQFRDRASSRGVIVGVSFPHADPFEPAFNLVRFTRTGKLPAPLKGSPVRADQYSVANLRRATIVGPVAFCCDCKAPIQPELQICEDCTYVK